MKTIPRLIAGAVMAAAFFFVQFGYAHPVYAALVPNDTIWEGPDQPTYLTTADIGYGLVFGPPQTKLGWYYVATGPDILCGVELRLSGSLGAGDPPMFANVYEGRQPGINNMISNGPLISSVQHLSDIVDSTSSTRAFYMNDCVQMKTGKTYLFTLQFGFGSWGNSQFSPYLDGVTATTTNSIAWQNDNYNSGDYTIGTIDRAPGALVLQYGLVGRWFGRRNTLDNEPGGCFGNNSSSSTTDWFNLGNIIGNVVSCLFVPSQAAWDRLDDAKVDLSTRVPFAYISEVSSTVSGLEDPVDTTTTDVYITIPPSVVNSYTTSAMVLWNWDTIKNKTQDLLAPIRIAFGVMLWGAWLWGLYEMAVTFFKSK